MLGTSAVEVRKSTKSTTWYKALLLDVTDDGQNAKVSFEDNVWPTREVPTGCVRLCPASVDSEEEKGEANEHGDNEGDAGDGDGPPAQGGFQPEPDDMVEVRSPASEHSPSCWALGRVKTVNSSFYFIGLSSGGSRGSQDTIVERCALRPCSGEPTLDAHPLSRRLVPVAAELRGWIRSEDSAGCLSHVQKVAGVLVARSLLLADAADHGGPSEVVLVGEEKPMMVAERLLTQIHFRCQVDMQHFHALRQDFLRRLEELRQKHDAMHREVFTVDQHLVGRLIGKKGENIKQVRERHGVEVKVHDEDCGDDETAHARVVVTGESQDAVRLAREDLELVTDRISLETEQVGWILGKGYQNITDIAKKTELIYARFDDRAGCLELRGLKHQVDSARLLIEAHTGYLSTYKQLGEEQDAIRERIGELDASIGPSRQKGATAGKGGGRGRGGNGQNQGGGSGRKGNNGGAKGNS